MPRTILTAVLLVVAATAPATVTPPTMAAPATAAAQRSWAWPLTPPLRVTAPFVAPATPYSAGHRGVDFAASAGEPVLAPTAATVAFAGTVVDRPVLTLRVSETTLVSFEPVAAAAPVGAAVAAGQPVGTVGRGGRCDGVCLHVGVRVDGQYVSPMLFYADVPAAVLLPLS